MGWVLINALIGKVKSAQNNLSGYPTNRELKIRLGTRLTRSLGSARRGSTGWHRVEAANCAGSSLIVRA